MKILNFFQILANFSQNKAIKSIFIYAKRSTFLQKFYKLIKFSKSVFKLSKVVL